MKVVLIGASGQLGSDLCRALDSFDLVPLLHSDIEITDTNSVRQAFEYYQPEVVINTAAYHRVDDCEDDPDTGFLVNALGARNVAVAAELHSAKIVYLSTDYIFGGERGQRSTPYTEFDSPIPANTYGRSKLAGEDFVRHLCRRHFIVRASGLFGVAGASGKGGNFVETMLRLARERDELRVVNDQIFSPTSTRDLAGKIAQLLPTEYYGVFHITNRGVCSWYEFAREIVRLGGLDARVVPITSAEYPTPARRPGFSVLDNYHLRLLGLDDMRPWQEALRDYMEEKGHINAPSP
ncbi:dTDP-4-dehydrorhamnose reductase [Chloroflexota bacterium]